MFVRFNFGATGLDKVKTAGIAVVFHQGRGNFNKFVFYDAARAAQETKKFIFGVGFFKTVQQTADDVVSARGLTAGKNHAHAHGLFAGGGIGAFYKSNFRQAVGVGENPFYGGLVGYAFGRFTQFGFYGRGAFFEDVGKHRLVFAAVLLKMRTNAFSGMFSRHYSSPVKIKSLPLLYKIPPGCIGKNKIV